MEEVKHIIYDDGFAIALGVIASALIFSGIKSNRNFLKHVFYTTSALFAALFLFEIYSFFTHLHTNSINDEKSVKFSGTYADNMNATGRKKEVGYGPREDSSFQVSSIRKNGDTVVYNVTFTFENGIRRTPNSNPLAKNYALFLGCSYVFGDGLNDNQTLPFYFNEYTQRTFNVINFGFNGYGPHQALKIVEEKIIKNKNILSSDSSIAVYSFIPSHFLRAAGYSVWDVYGPWYEVENDSLVCKGEFNDKRLFRYNYVTKRLNIIWRNSGLYNSFFSPEVDKKGVIRVIELLKVMKKKLNGQGISFFVLVGSPDNNKFQNFFYKELNNNHIPHFFVDSIISDVRSNPAHYFIRRDGHPNENYNKKIAEFFSKKINGK